MFSPSSALPSVMSVTRECAAVFRGARGRVRVTQDVFFGMPSGNFALRRDIFRKEEKKKLILVLLDLVWCIKGT